MPHCLTLLLTGAIALGLAAVSYAGPTLYVSPKGDDTGSGSKEKPFRTLQRARDEIRKLKNAGGLPEGGVTVELLTGRYELAKPFELTAEDSGADGAPITYRAAARGKAVLTGALVLKNRQPVTDPAILKLLDENAKGKVCCTDLDAGLIETIPGFANGGCGYRGKRDYPVALYQDGRRLPIARWPNDEYAKIGECLGKSHIAGHVGVKFTDGIFRFDDPRLQRWVGEPDLWFDGLWFHPWADQKMQLKEIDLKTKTISLRDPESHHFGFKKGQGFYAFNAIGEIDRPGEWAVDREKRRLYLWPAADLQAEPVTLSLGENLVKAEDLAHVAFDGLLLEECRHTAVLLKNCTDVTLSGCTLRHTGSWGVEISGGSRCTVIGCDLYDLGEGGVSAHGGKQDTLTPGEHLIENNHIHHFGRIVNTYRPGAAVYGVGNTIRHNLIHHAQHQAVYFRGNDHLIEYNIIHDVCLHTSDAGALYACARDWSLRGVVIRHNLIHATGEGVDACGSQGIYLDDYTSGATIVGNICTMVGHSVTTCGNCNRIENNIGINSRKSAFNLSSRGIDSFAKKTAAQGEKSYLVWKLLAKNKPYQSEAWRARYPNLPKLLDMIAADPVGAHDSHFCIMRNNVNVGGVPAKVRNAKKITRTCTIESNVNLYDDPGFVDLAGFDLRLRDNARVYKKLPGFKALQFERMGLYADARRASPAVKFGPEVTPMPEIQPRIPRPELKPRYILEERDGKAFKADGIAGDKEWPKTRKAELECVNKIYRAPSTLPCTARFAFDGERLLVFATVEVDPDKPMKMGGKWGGRDGLELAFSGTDEDAAVFLVHCFPDGTVSVSSDEGAAAERVKALEEAVAYGAKAEKGKWTAEIAIPLAAAGMDPATFRQLRFNMNVRRTCDNTWTCWWSPEEGITDLLSSGLLIRPRKPPETEEMVRRREAAKPLFEAERTGEFHWERLPNWTQTADPDRLGPAGQKADAETVSFSDYSGWAVARRKVKLTAEQLAQPFCALFFPCVDEEGEVYINGKLMLAHTAKATGTAPGLLWREPFLVDLTKAVTEAGEVDVAVHLRGNMGTGGLRKGVFLVWGQTAPSAQQLYDFLAENPKLGWRDRVPAFWRDFERERIPTIPAAPDEDGFGKRIQRTMNLLASSTAEKRNRVRILFYGQSITQGMHSREMINVLRSRFPWAIIDFENEAIGGFGASSLVRTGEHDLYPRDVDLLVFHVYGDAESLNTIFSNVRKRNTSDILVYTHHYNWVSDPDSLQEKLHALKKSVAEWHELAEKYQMELAPVYRDWPTFFRKHDWGINEVMGDTVHTNVHHNPAGHTLLAKLVLRNFRHHPGNPLTYPDAIRDVPATDAAVQTTGAWEQSPQGVRTSEKGASLKLIFEGNRIDVVAFPCEGVGSATVRIDGKSPAESPGLYYCTRTSKGPYIWMPAIKRVDLSRDIVPKLETWTLTPANVDTEKKTFTFRLEGSVTGFDGEGDNEHDFVSNSGIIRIGKKDFHVLWPLSYRKKPYPADFKVTWEVRPLFVETWRPCANSVPEIEDCVTLVKGLPNGRHTLEIVADGDGVVPVKGFRVHRPPQE